MSEPSGSSATGQAAKELLLTRILGAPRSLVFKAWTDRNHLARWWGPRGFTNPVCEIDVRPGGLIRIDMRGPDGMVYPMKGVFHEIVEPELLVFTSTALEDENGKPLFEILNTITFEDFHGITKLTLHARLVTREFKMSPQVAAALSGMEQGWSESLYRLADEVDNISRYAGADREIVISRLIDAPRALVFDAWTNAEHIGKWWGPHGFTTTTYGMDSRPGGEWRFVMHGPDGTDYKNKISYIEVLRPERLVYKHEGREKDEAVKFQSTVTFTEQGNKTNVTLRMVFATAAVRAFVIEKHGAIEGGKQTLERLAQHLAG
ncbi:MAG: SRPBCC family protein [Candidatus Acidiferrum sp.]